MESIIAPSQATFIPGRYMNDNIIVSHEIMHYLNKKKGWLSLMALKIDMNRADDRVW